MAHGDDRRPSRLPCRSRRHGRDGERGAEPLQGLSRVAGGPGLETDDAGVAEPVEGGRDRGMVDGGVEVLQGEDPPGALTAKLEQGPK
jgi:hypothetical protein